MGDADTKYRLSKEVISRFPSGVWEDTGYAFTTVISEEIKKFLEELDEAGLLSPGFSSAKIGDAKEVLVALPRNNEIFFSKSISGLIENKIYKHSPPRRVFIQDLSDGFSPTESPKGETLQAYRELVELIGVLKSICDHQDGSSATLCLIFLSGEKIEVPIKYSQHDLARLEKIQIFKTMYEEELHLSQRRAIFKSILSDTLRNIKPELRFAHLVANFEHIVSRVSDNYELYVSEFSFEKVKKKVQSEITQYLLKINATFSDIQTQLLTLPIAGLLAAGQMDAEGGSPLKNVLITAASLCFAMLLGFVLKNHYASLGAIKSEIDSQKASLREEYSALSDRFEQEYQVLDDRYEAHKRLAWGVATTVLITLVVIPVALLLFLSFPDVVECLKDYAKYFLGIAKEISQELAEPLVAYWRGA